jgi:putative nucleotidyltransferase with HDIG domain
VSAHYKSNGSVRYPGVLSAGSPPTYGTRPGAAEDIVRLQRIRRQALRLRVAVAEADSDKRTEILEGLLEMAANNDMETEKHTLRVGEISAVIAAEMGWPEDAIADLRVAAALHDIGKVGVPRDLLMKQETVTETEMDIISSHTEIGAGLLSGSDMPLLRMAKEIAHAHHERWDGTGYPRAQKGADISEAARIVSVADAYDVMVHERPYKKASSHAAAMDEIARCSGGMFDPVVCAAAHRAASRIRTAVSAVDEPDHGPRAGAVSR